MKIKKHFVQGVKEFISIMENKPIEGFTRGEHETCVLAANILRRSLKKGLPEDVWVGAEIRDISTKRYLDIVLVGDSKNPTDNGSVCILEFKQWTKVDLISANPAAYNAVSWGSTPKYHEYGEDKATSPLDRERCPLFQINEYHKSMRQNMLNSEITSALVFPNMIDSSWAEKMKKVIAKNSKYSEHKVYTKDSLDALAKNLANIFSRGPSQKTRTEITKYYGKVHRKTKYSSGFIETPVEEFYPKENPASQSPNRHGWVGGVDVFIKNCENNRFAKIFIDKKVAERRAIIFSCNHLATVLRQLWIKNKILVEHLCIVIEFTQMFGGKMIDVVFALQGKNQADISLFAVEMKAWSHKNEELDGHGKRKEIEYEIHEDLFLDGRKLPSRYSYPVAGEVRKVCHPVEQVREYIQVLESEYRPENIGGCAWLHNVHDGLLGNMKALHEKHHVMINKDASLFERSGFKSLPLVTRKYSYSGPTSGWKREEKGLLEELQASYKHLKPVKFDSKCLERLCDLNPALSSFSVEKAFKNSKVIFGDTLKDTKPLLDEQQLKIAYSIIEKAKQGVAKPTEKVIITVEGDAGTGKTLIALAAIGKILNYLKEKKITINKSNYPALICANNPAASALVRGCMTSTESDMNGKYIGANFIKNRTEFNSLNEFFLADKLHGFYRVEKKTENQNDSMPCVLMFDETQLLSHYTDGGNAPALRKYFKRDKNDKIVKKNGKNVFKDEGFEDWLNLKNYRFPGGMRSDLKTDIEVLSALSPVTVIFLDERQATRLSAIGNISIEKIKKFAKTNNILHIEEKLETSYRSENCYTQMIKEFLYGDKPKSPHPQTCDHKFSVEVSQTEEKFLQAFNERKVNDESFSCGMVAGYTREHISKDDDTKFDWKFDSGDEFQWNEAPGDKWIFSNQRRKQRIGYFLAVQGNELDEMFVYIGKDLSYDKTNSSVLANLKIHQPKSACVKLSKNNGGIEVSEYEKQKCILNQYWVLLTRAKKKVTIFCEDELLNDYLKMIKNDFGY